MADSKITALTALTAADPTVDMFPVVDVSDTTMAASGTTKRISINNILACSPSATLASATITGDLTVDTNTLKVVAATDSVGVGFTPSAWAGGRKAIQIGSPAQLVSSDLTLEIGSNWWHDGTNYKYTAANPATLYSPSNGSHVWYNATAGLVNGTIGWSTLMTLNSTGLGVGVTPSAWGNASKVVQVGQAGSVYGRASFGYYGTKFNLYNDNTNDIAISTNFVGEYRFELLNGSHVWLNKSTAGSIGVAQTLTQAMTLDASGNLLVGTTNTSATAGVGFKSQFSSTVPQFAIVVNEAGTSSSLSIYNVNAAAYRFYVNNGGTVFATNTTISAISDARLKENVQDIDVGLGAILALKPRKFDWKAGKGKDIKGDRGFIAQEFEQVFPNLIDEWKDAAPEGEAPYKSVRQDLIPVLVKAIQELTARVQTLETR